MFYKRFLEPPAKRKKGDAKIDHDESEASSDESEYCLQLQHRQRHHDKHRQSTHRSSADERSREDRIGQVSVRVCVCVCTLYEHHNNNRTKFIV